MSKKRAMTPKKDDFAALLADVKGRIQSAQTRAVVAVNTELVRLYWDIGRIIAGRQQREGWGTAVIPRLAAELKNEIPELKGFSERNIKRMLAFYRDFPEPIAIVPPPVAQLPAPLAKLRPVPIVQEPPAKLVPTSKVPQAVALLPNSLLWAVPWAHHVILMDKMPDIPTRRWYMEQIARMVAPIRHRVGRTVRVGWKADERPFQGQKQYDTQHGNRDVIISVGYRVKSLADTKRAQLTDLQAPLVFGLKGPFYQPRAKPWVLEFGNNSTPKGSFMFPFEGSFHAPIAGEGVHPQTTGTSPEGIVSRQISHMVAPIRHRVGRTVRSRP